MQWPPAIRNYMRKVRLKYISNVIANFPLLTASLNTIEYMHACKNHQKNTCTTTINATNNCILWLFFIATRREKNTITTKLIRVKGGWDMLIFQRHSPHIIRNSWQPLHDLSHSTTTFRRAQSPYQHVTLKTQPSALLL